MNKRRSVGQATKRKRRRPAVKEDNKTPATDEATYQALRWLLEGYDERQIAEALAKQHPEADGEACLRRVMDHLAAVGSASMDVARGWVLESLRELYQRALEVNDLAVALRCVKELRAIATPEDDDA